MLLLPAYLIPSLSTLQFGRIAQIRQSMTQLTRLHFWLHAGMSHTFFQHFCSALWGFYLGRRISQFMYMIAHVELPIRTWAATVAFDPTSTICLDRPVESIQLRMDLLYISSGLEEVCLVIFRIGIQHGHVT